MVYNCVCFADPMIVLCMLDKLVNNMSLEIFNFMLKGSQFETSSQCLCLLISEMIASSHTCVYESIVVLTARVITVHKECADCLIGR